jgi:hypothetical protein
MTAPKMLGCDVLNCVHNTDGDCNREYIGISDEGMCDYLKIKEEG